MKLRPILGIIPARGGSKAIEGKNLRELAGRPLLEYAVQSARLSGIIDRLILSTDSPEIAELAKSLLVEVPFIRPAELAADGSPMQLTVEHAVGHLENQGWSPAAIFILQPTAPLRKPEHLINALAILEETGCDSVVSVIKVPSHYAPHYAMKIVDGRLLNFLPEGARISRRQDVEAAYSRDGTIYVVRREVLMMDHSIYGKDCRPMVLQPDESVNLDTIEDWKRAEEILQSRTKPLLSTTS